MADINTTRAPVEMVRTQVAAHSAGSEIGTRMMGRSPVTQEAVRTGGVDQSDISDALEELGAAVANRRKPRMEETKVRKGAGANMEAMGRIAQYQDKLPDQPSEQKFRDLRQRFEEFQRTMERGGGGAGRPTADDVLQALADYDADPTHQFAALEQLRSQTAALGAGAEFLGVLDEARAKLREGATGRDVTAGFAAAGMASDRADDFEADPQAIRDAYRAVVRDNQHLGQIFDHLRGFNIASQFEEIVDSFTKVAARELDLFAGEGDTVTIGETAPLLANVLGELSKLKQMRTLFGESRKALDTMERVHPELSAASGRPDETALTSRMLHFSANPTASANDAEGVIDGLSGEDPGVAVTAINTMRNVHASLPDAAMPSLPAREQQNRAMMDLSSRLVAQEEAYFEAHA